jgi:hypothetical protein
MEISKGDNILRQIQDIFFLFVFIFQGKFEEALQVVEGSLGEKLISYVFVPLKRAGLLMKLERWRDANILYKLLLREE